MSLIHQALEKTSRVQEIKIVKPSRASEIYSRDLTGGVLEEELAQVQKSHVSSQRLYRKISWGVLAVFFIAGLSYVEMQANRPKAKAGVLLNEAKVVPAPELLPAVKEITLQAPIEIASGNIFRLTGITDLGNGPMAVINDEIVKVGDSLQGKAIVKAIGHGEVRLDVQGKETKLTL